jgi:predicted metallo-beta-lactamase superfamily hydrolase
MEPVSWTLGAIVAALVAKSVDQAAERVVSGAAEALHRVTSWLRERFSGEKDEAGARALARVADAPDSPSRARELAEVIDQRSASDPEFRTSLEALVTEARKAGVQVGSITQVARGNQNVQNAAIADSEIHISYGPPDR